MCVTYIFFYMFRLSMMKMTFAWMADVSLTVIWLVLCHCVQEGNDGCITAEIMNVHCLHLLLLLLFFPSTHSSIFLCQRKFRRGKLLICIKTKDPFNLPKDRAWGEIKCLTNGLIKSAICIETDSECNEVHIFNNSVALVWSNTFCVNWLFTFVALQDEEWVHPDIQETQ